jgi:hypothetical protein
MYSGTTDSGLLFDRTGIELPPQRSSPASDYSRVVAKWLADLAAAERKRLRRYSA